MKKSTIRKGIIYSAVALFILYMGTCFGSTKRPSHSGNTPTAQEKKCREVPKGPKYDPDSAPRKPSKHYNTSKRIERAAPKPRRHKKPAPLRIHGNGKPIDDDPKMVNAWWESEAAY